MFFHTNMPPLPLLLLVMMMTMLLGVSKARPPHVANDGSNDNVGGCLGLGHCCRGRNLTCASSGQTADNKDASTACFCDEECLTIGDCCLDYRAACRGD